MLDKALDLGISLTPIAKVDYGLKLTNDVINDLSTDPRHDTSTLHPYKREQKIGENLGKESRKLAKSLEETFESKNPKKLFGNIAVVIDNLQEIITTVASSVQHYMGYVNVTNIDDDMIKLYRTDNTEYFQKAQKAKNTLDEGAVGLFTSLGLKPIADTARLAERIIVATEKPIKINSWQEIVERSNNCSKQLAKDSSKLLEGNVGGLVNYFQNLINRKDEDGYRRL